MQHSMIIGPIVKSDPEIKQTKNGPFCTFRVALRRRGANKKTDYVHCVAFAKNAEFICKYFKKHDPIALTGEWQDNAWKQDEKGYDIPNWQFVIAQADFLPIPKSARTSSDDVYMPDAAIAGVAAQDDFSVIGDNEDLPF